MTEISDEAVEAATTAVLKELAYSDKSIPPPYSKLARDCARAALQAAAPLGPKWQSMGSAPRDWSHPILLAYETEGVGRLAGKFVQHVEQARYYVGDDGPEWWLDNDSSSPPPRDEDCLGWMEIPQPPKSRVLPTPPEGGKDG